MHATTRSRPVSRARHRKNVAFRNQPFDIFWDGAGTDVRFKGNRCATSRPEGLCD